MWLDESGSGKSVSSLSLMRLVEFGGGKISNGSIMYIANKSGSNDLSKEDPKKIREIYQGK